MTKEIKLTDNLSIFHWARGQNQVVNKHGMKVLHVGTMASCKKIARQILSVNGVVPNHLGLLLR